MPTTAKKLIPYPVATDTPDVPRDIAALAARLELLLAQGEGGAAGVDLNTVTTPGMYALDTVTNGPAGMAGIFLEVRSLAAGTYTEQVASYAYINTSARWRRVQIAGAWSAWRLVTPHAETSGIATIPIPAATVAIIFPTGLFAASTNPVVTATIVNGAGSMATGVVRVSSPAAATGATLLLSNYGSTTGSVVVNWHARQEMP